ncbi:MAG: M20 family metallopeptidase [Victivallaceae bacterium]
MTPKEKIEDIVDGILPEVTALRHAIHRNPELAGNEFSTAALIRNTLIANGLKLLPPFLKTDVVGILKGKRDGKNIALRADIDALPMQELNNFPYKSSVDGRMHACGHDGHAAMLIGAAMVLNKLRDELKGSVRFVFQPGEEIAAMGKDLVDAGALKNPEPDAVFAIHAQSGYPAGSIISRSGTIMAAVGFFKLKITGRGGHGSRPELTVDPILAGSRIVESLQSIVSRNIDPQAPAVISVCRFEGGKNANVIPEEVILEGTTRFFDNKVGEQIHRLIEQTVKGVCLASGATYEFEYKQPYIPTVNDSVYVEAARKVTEKYLGSNMWFEMERASLGGEDFAFYLRDYPGAFCFIGIGEDSPALHNPNFDFNDEAMRNGIIYMVAMTLETMEAN